MVKMNTGWIFLCALCAWSPVLGTYRPSSVCQCHGKAQNCMPDAFGLRCLNCQGNTEGRHCESCKQGFYHQRAGESCMPCDCNPAGSQGPGCDHRGWCVCKPGIQGDKCDRCANGATLSASGCEPHRSGCRWPLDGQEGGDSERCLPCFCYGHSTQCSSTQGYTTHNITSTFQTGSEGWKVATATGVTPSQVQFRWSPTHKDLEAISEDIRPVYLFAPASYLGDQSLSYGQTLSFSLRLDRGVRRPSTSDVVLEGAGLSVSASIGDLKTIIPCGKKTTYTFRLDEQLGSQWTPRLSPLQFQTLLSDLTALKIRATFGENGRGYLDNVTLVSAKPGSTAPAGWVEDCSCPVGHEGRFCERCAKGYKRRDLGTGALSPCDPCGCQAGSCDPETGDCLSADDTHNDQSCPSGYYSNPLLPSSCVKCPCPQGDSCSVNLQTLDVKCDTCPPGTTGTQCQECVDGFYGDPLGEHGPRRPCQQCQCNGHVDLGIVGGCDQETGECLRCRNYTSGFNCEGCLKGYYHSLASEACKECDCSPLGSVSTTCDGRGQCVCRPGFEGLRCDRSSCPSCFSPIKRKMENYELRLQEMEDLLRKAETGGAGSESGAKLERSLQNLERMVDDLHTQTDTLTEAERSLQLRLGAVSRALLAQARGMSGVTRTVEAVMRQGEELQTEAGHTQTLLNDIEQKLRQAVQDINQADFPLSDAPLGNDFLSSLVQKATQMADQHEGIAEGVVQTANSALGQAEKALAQMTSALSGENSLTESIGGLKNQYETDSSRVKALDKRAGEVSSAAQEASRQAGGLLKQLPTLEGLLPQTLQKDIGTMVASLDGLKGKVEGSVAEYQDLEREVQAGQKEAQDLLDGAKAAQKADEKLLVKANAAKKLADSALSGISTNLAGVDGILDQLRGFDDQISGHKALADEAISKLPGISATVRGAASTNRQTQDLLDGMSDQYNDAVDALGALGNTVSTLEGLSGSLDPSGLVENTAALRGDLETLQDTAGSTADRLTLERTQALLDRDRAQEAATDANAAHKKAQLARDAVGDMLKNVAELMGGIGSPGTVDEQRLTELEQAIGVTRHRMDQELQPRLRGLEEQEARQRVLITRLLRDISTILGDIDNLQDIRDSIPVGCYNLPPIERP